MKNKCINHIIFWGIKRAGNSLKLPALLIKEKLCDYYIYSFSLLFNEIYAQIDFPITLGGFSLECRYISYL